MCTSSTIPLETRAACTASLSCLAAGAGGASFYMAFQTETTLVT